MPSNLVNLTPFLLGMLFVRILAVRDLFRHDKKISSSLSILEAPTLVLGCGGGGGGMLGCGLFGVKGGNITN